MPMSGPARELDKDCNVSPHQWLGVDETVGGFQQFGKVVQIDRDIGMVRPEALFVDGERSAQSRGAVCHVGAATRYDR